tara:strand:+ start:3222 stop:4205 length:984 start_codon:yes stop_codon:yes gene_type:complete
MNNELKNMNNSLKKFHDAYKEYHNNYKNNSDEINDCLEIFKILRTGSDMYTYSSSSPSIPKHYYDETSKKNYILMYDKFLIKTNMSDDSFNTIKLDEEYKKTRKITVDIDGHTKTLLHVLEDVDINNLTNDINKDLDKVYQVNLNDLYNKYPEITKYDAIQSLRSIAKLDNSFNFTGSECNMNHFNYCYSKATMNNNKYFGLKELRNDIDNADCECYYGDDSGDPEDVWVVHEVDVESINSLLPTPNKGEYLSILMDGNLYSVNEKDYGDVFKNYLTERSGSITKIMTSSNTDIEKCDPIVGSGVSELEINLTAFNKSIRDNCSSTS